MSPSERFPVPSPAQTTLVAAQVGRTPRTPWRIAATCSFGRATVIVSPSRLDDGTPFPTFAWLTCPHLVERVGVAESAGDVAEFAQRASSDDSFADALRSLDDRVRTLRAAESGGVDACATVGVGGQRDPLGVKCLHLHVALALLGEADPVGSELLAGIARECDSDRCGRLSTARTSEEDQ